MSNAGFIVRRERSEIEGDSTITDGVAHVIDVRVVAKSSAILTAKTIEANSLVLVCRLTEG